MIWSTQLLEVLGVILFAFMALFYLLAFASFCIITITRHRARLHRD